MPSSFLPDWNDDQPDRKPAVEDGIRAHFKEYSWFLDRAERAWRRNSLQAACTYASLAALVATHRHCGFFASPRLERMLNTIGRNLRDKTAYRRDAGTSRRVLHVCTEVAHIGGLSNMLARLVNADPSRQHSVAVTRYSPDIPAFISEAVAASGGAVHCLGQTPRSFCAQALALRRLAREHDLVVLHVFNEDVVPLLAFARLDTVPPVMLLNHADHLFWLGSSISDLVINLRSSGENLSTGRRGIAAERNALLPTLVNSATRKRAVESAKRELGLEPDAVVLISVARPTKYRTHKNITFADTHVSVLLDNPNAHLIVVGAGEPEDWAQAKAATGGRIVSLAPLRDPSPYFEAADIYVDSYPFVSATSMMEAAGYALPLVSRFYAPKEAEIVGIDQPGLKAATLFASDDSQYVEILRKLISAPDFRRQQGASAERAVKELHLVPKWNSYWEAAIAQAKALPPLDGARIFADAPDETPSFGEPDLRIHDMFGFDIPTAQWVKERLRYLPAGERLARWNDVRRSGRFHSRREAIVNLLPDHMLARLGKRTRTDRSYK